MRVRFWGTRGSIPVAMTGATVRDKLVAALVQAAGTASTRRSKAHAFVDPSSTFAHAHVRRQFRLRRDRYGRREYVLCDMGSGRAARSAGTCCAS